MKYSSVSRPSRKFDLIGRAAELTEKSPQPAALFTHGEKDEMFPVAEIRALGDRLQNDYETYRVAVNTFPHLAHHLDLTAEMNPAVEKDIHLFQEAVSAWYRRYLL